MSDDLVQQLQNQLQAMEAELAEARWQAASAHRAKEAFLANMNHELHTPLNAILGFAELMREDIGLGRYDTIHADLHKLIGAAVQMLSLVNELLDLSKLEANKMGLHITQFDIQEPLLRALDQVRSPLATQDNELTLNIDPNLHTITGDADKIRQVLFHLLDNAAKFTTQGQIQLTAVPCVREDQLAICFFVTDTGIGMSPRQAEEVFEAFTQVDPSATRHYEGTGLGLYICRRLCELMGGQITVRSELGKGSEFSFWIPTIPPATAVDPPQQQHQAMNNYHN